MAIPNTTPTPNELFNGEMLKMKDTELRVVLIVTRATFGWIEDKETGLRKESDWITIGQMAKKSGKSERALNSAIKSCIKNGWIEARTEDGVLLDTPEKRMRYGRKIFYRLGEKFIKKATPAKGAEVTPAKSAEVTPAKNSTRPPQIFPKTPAKNGTILYKRNSTKETLTKDCNVTSVAGKEINDLIAMFEKVNPNFERLFSNKTQRSSMERLVSKYGADRISRAIDFVCKTSHNAYAPVITTPYQLEQKMGALLLFAKKEGRKGGVIDARNV